MWGCGVVQLPWTRKETDLRESPNDRTLTGSEGHDSCGEMFHPHYRENPVSSLPEHGVYVDNIKHWFSDCHEFTKS
jgi:hypothetical protein